MFIENETKHKVFISYYHKDDQYYKDRFLDLFGHLFINKSVMDGDIDTDLSTDYIKRLIQKEYITDSSVLIVLVGPNTHKRKHIDWEISAALSKKVGGYSGLMGLCLPEHCNYKKSNYTSSEIPQRLVDNLVTGYASLYDWTESETVIKSHIQKAFEARKTLSGKIDNTRIQMKINRS